MDQGSTNPFPATPQPSGNMGPLIATVIIVVLLAAGGFYFLSLRDKAPAQPAQGSAQAQGNSPEQLETELNATQTTGSQTDVDNLNSSL